MYIKNSNHRLLKIVLNELLYYLDKQRSKICSYRISYILKKNGVKYNPFILRDIYDFFRKNNFRIVERKGRATSPRKAVIISKNDRERLIQLMVGLNYLLIVFIMSFIPLITLKYVG